MARGEEEGLGGGEGGESEEDIEEDEANGTSRPRHATLWSHKVRCEVGRRCYAQYGNAKTGLWFRGTVVAVNRDVIGQWVDVAYDDGDTETMKPIKRVSDVEREDQAGKGCGEGGSSG